MNSFHLVLWSVCAYVCGQEVVPNLLSLVLMTCINAYLKAAYRDHPWPGTPGSSLFDLLVFVAKQQPLVTDCIIKSVNVIGCSAVTVFMVKKRPAAFREETKNKHQTCFIAFFPPSSSIV